MSSKSIYAILIVLVLIVLAAVAYEKGWLDRILPASWQPHKAGFVGAYGRTPEMQHCLAYSGPGRRGPYFNRCTWA